MICPGCQRAFAVEKTFASLFHRENLCPVCRKNFRFEGVLERIPLADGYLDCIAAYMQRTVPIHLENILLNEIDKSPILAILQNSSYELFLVVDPILYETFPTWFPWVKPFRRIAFLSFEPLDFSAHVMFF